MTRFWQCSPVATPIGRDRPGDRGVAEHVVGAGRLLDPPRVERGQAPHRRRSPRSTSHTWLASIIRRRSGPISSRIDRGAAHVVVEVAADLHLDVRSSPSATRLAAQRARPSRRSSRASRPTSCRRGSRRARISASRSRPRRRRSSQQLQRLVGRQRVGDVAEVDAGRRSARGVMSASSFHSGLPSALAHRSQTALTSAAVARWMTPFSGPSQRSWLSPVSARQNAAQVGGDRLERAADDERRRARGSPATHDLVAAADREGQAVTLQSIVRRSEDHVGGRVVRRRVHRVGAGQGARGGEAHVMRGHADDSVHAHPFTAPTRRPRAMNRSSAIAIATPA